MAYCSILQHPTICCAILYDPDSVNCLLGQENDQQSRSRKEQEADLKIEKRLLGFSSLRLIRTCVYIYMYIYIHTHIKAASHELGSLRIQCSIFSFASWNVLNWRFCPSMLVSIARSPIPQNPGPKSSALFTPLPPVSGLAAQNPEPLNP